MAYREVLCRRHPRPTPTYREGVRKKMKLANHYLACYRLLPLSTRPTPACKEDARKTKKLTNRHPSYWRLLLHSAQDYHRIAVCESSCKKKKEY